MPRKLTAEKLPPQNEQARNLRTAEQAKSNQRAHMQERYRQGRNLSHAALNAREKYRKHERTKMHRASPTRELGASEQGTTLRAKNLRAANDNTTQKIKERTQKQVQKRQAVR